MPFNLVVPPLSESVLEATVADWLKQPGERVEAGEVVVVLETDKVSLEVTADQAGVISSISHPVGDDVVAGDVLGVIDESGTAVAKAAETPAVAPEPGVQPVAQKPASDDPKATPVARRVAEVNNVDLAKVPASDSGKVMKADVQNYIAGQQKAPAAPAPQPAKQAASATVPIQREAREERVKLSRRRRTIAARLIEAQSTAAMLTTFNEIDMSAVQAVRQRRKDAFKEQHGVNLGLMPFFVKATIGALKVFPAVNAEIDSSGTEVIYKHYYDIGMAVGAEEGLVVPVLRDADRMSFAAIEKQIRAYSAQVQAGTLAIEALLGGTFTITNGGVFGSLMSTPILNYPQVGILGLHAIKDRPIVVNGEIAIRPMMYVALSYDHRIIDGREAVQFLVRVKDFMEDPERLLIEG